MKIKHEEAISLLVNATYSREWQGNERLAKAQEMAIDALEKQRPMEPGPDELGISARDPVITPCGNCGMELTDRMWDFCPWCGQKIGWRKEKWEGKVTKDPKLEPCRCGRPAEVQYIAGLGRGVIEHVSNPFKSSYPTYYIHCPVCNRNLCIRITRGSAVEYRDRARRKLIRKWNAVMRADIDLIPANTKNVWEVTK